MITFGLEAACIDCEVTWNEDGSWWAYILDESFKEWTGFYSYFQHEEPQTLIEDIQFTLQRHLEY